MECIAIFCLANLYFELGAGVIKDLPPPPTWAVEKFGPDVHYKYDFNRTANPRGRLAIGHEWNYSARVRWSLELRHESWIATPADKGENGVWLSVRALPWRWEPR